jgi:hypothetical protein
VDVEQSQPILVIMPHVREKRIRGIRFRPFGIKNPFYPMYRSVPLTFDLRAWVTRLVEIEKLGYELAGASASSPTDKPATVEENAALVRVTPAALSVKGDSGQVKRGTATTSEGSIIDKPPHLSRVNSPPATGGDSIPILRSDDTRPSNLEIRAIEKILPSESVARAKLKKIKTLTPQQRKVLERYLAENSTKVLGHPNGSIQDLTWKECEAKYISAGVVQLKLSTFSKLFNIPKNSIQKRTLEGEAFVELRY